MQISKTNANATCLILFHSQGTNVGSPKTPTPTETAPPGGGFPQAPAQPETKLQRFTREQVASVE